MWKMLDIMDAELFLYDCDDCAGMPLAPPPQFLIPPPPRPPALAEYTVVPQDCNEDQLAQQQWESDVCQAIPILDASLYSSQSLATSAMIAVFSLLLILIVLISSLFVWKNKRKVQNLLPCKTPTRGPLNGAMPLGGSSTHNSHAMYEDPDAHLGHHRPLVMRHHHHHHHHAHHYQQHHHAEMLHGKSIHYPSGYPMTRSPPFLVSSSPGPDPYRSNDNVYEELGPGRVDSDGESEPPLHSDDDFAEDELSLPGECSFNKEATSTPAAVSLVLHTPYHERAATSSAAAAAASTLASTSGAASAASSAGSTQPPHERHSVLSSSSSTAHDASTATATSSSSHTNSSGNNNNNSEATGAAAAATPLPSPSSTAASQLLSGMLRHTTGRSKFQSAAQRQRLAARQPQQQHQRQSPEDLNTSGSTADIAEIAPLYDNRSNMMSLGYLPQQLQQHSAARSTAPQFYNTLENEVERRNRINAQLSQTPLPPVSTIFRERIHYPGSGRYAQPYYAPNSANGLLAHTMRARTNPRTVERRLTHQLPAAHQHQHHRIHAAPLSNPEPAYGYAEPMYNANYFYEPATTGPRQPHSLAYASTAVTAPYIMPDYRQQQLQQPMYARNGGGDSSFGSDSGYSHHTPASSIGRHDYDLAEPLPLPPAPKPASKLSAALSFGWHRNRKQPPGSSAVSSLRSSSNEATSPNNNSACSTVTSQLEQCSTASGSNNNANAPTEP